MNALHRFEWAASWTTGTDIDRAEQDIFRLYTMLLHADSECGEDGCFVFPADASFIEWFPNNPFTQPGLITAGYNAPAWYVANASQKTVMTDLSRFPAGSLPSVIPASGLPRLRVHAIGPALVRLHMFSIVAGSIAQVTVDDNPASVEMVDLNKDVFSAPPETDEDVIIEREIPAGPHHIDVIIVSMVNDEIPFVYHGGGVRAVEICGGDAVLEPRFKFENCTLYVSWDGGNHWDVVPGWDTFAPACFQGPPGQDGQDGENAQPFDLRFNSCTLEYSQDGAQSWNPVNGWEDWLACIPGGQTYDLRFRDGLLEWSKDGGQDWAVVDGWTQNLPTLLEGKDRCLNAWGCSFGLKELTAAFAGHIFQSSTKEEYQDAIAAEWLAQFGPARAVPYPAMGAFIDFTWDAADHQALYDDIGSDENASELAARIYTVMPNGEWCEQNIELFMGYYLCENTPSWMAAIILMVDCVFSHPLEFFRRKERARMFNYRALGTCQDCTTLEEIEPCAGAGHCHYFDFRVGTDGWYAYTGEWTAQGFKTVPYFGAVDYLSVGIGLPPAGEYSSASLRYVFDGTAPDANIWVYAVVSGQTILLADRTADQGQDVTVSVPTNATQLIARASCGIGNVYLESVMLDYTSPTALWSNNCSRG